MNRREFTDMIAEEHDRIVELNATKGKDYAGDVDVLSNFRQHAEALGLTQEQIWAVYAGKHWDAIQTYCRDGAVASEPIEGRLQDLIVYCYLQLAMVAEMREDEKLRRMAKSASQSIKLPGAGCDG